ncbi:MAG: hypothetical protein NTW03_12005, partial [Verrucomicrobia bacterium]|nr:hypothetical protein [Verrucomicrobiota bacterium]
SPVPGETRLSDNTNGLLVPVAIGLTNRTLLAKGSFWRYNDKGVDLLGTPWKQTNYYDLVWNGTNAPLGYDDGLNPPGQTNLNNVLSWGPDVNNTFITYYFRTAFNMDARPNNLVINTRYDDGVVLYLNGAELARYNMPTGAITATTLAASTISGAGQYVYYSTNASPTNLVFGRNVLAAEVHQSATNGSDIAFDLEMLGVAPNFPQIHEVDALAISTPAGVLAGDKLPVTVTLTNAGNGTESVLVVLRDAATGQIIGTKALTDLHPADSASVRFDWNTLGVTNGTHTVLAYTVVAGTTNLAGAAPAPAIISGSGFGLNAVNAAGSMGGRCSAVSTTGNLLLVGAGATFEVWDRSNPVVPVKLGAVRLPGVIQNIVASGSWAFAACGNAGVQFVELTSPSSPRHRNTFNSSGHAYSVALSGNFLYVADGVAGLRVVNVVNPASPWLAGVYYTEGPARDITVLGTTAYLLDQQKGLLVLDVSSPASPALAGAFTDLNSGQSLVVSANLAFIVDGNNHFLVVNVATPSAPALAGSLLLSGMVGQSLVLNGATVYVAAGDSGLLTIDATTPSAPVLVSTLATPGQAVDLALAGSKLYLADGLAGFQVLNVSSPASPVVQADMPTALRAADAVVTNNLAYVASGETGLRIFSLTNPTSPLLLSRFTGAANARCVAVSGSTAYVGDGQYGLKVVNVAAPSSPVLLGAYSSTNLGSIRSIGAMGNHVLVSDGRNVQLLDASSPANPLLVSTYNPPTFAFSLTVAGSKAYLACGNSGLIILNITSSALPPIGSYDTAGLATGVSVSGNNAYVADGASGWLILDVSNPASPTLLKSVTAQGPISDVAVSGTTAALGNGANTAITVDARNPLSPVAANSFGGLVRAMRVAATPSLTLAMEDEAGLALLGNDLNNDGLPDWWEQQILDASLAVNGPIRSIWDVRPTDDFDHDGLSNQAEFLAGTSPVDPQSRFALLVPTVADGSPVTVRWTSVANKIYTVWRSTNLTLPNSFVIQQDNIPSTPPVNTYTEPAPSSPAFYIISVR